MKKAIALLTLIIFLVPLSAAMAKGGANHRAAIDRKWKQVEVWQKKQAERFQRIERGATGEIKFPAGETYPDTLIWRDECPECGG